MWLDRAVAFSRRLSPLAGLAIVPIGLIARRALLSRWKLLGSLARWAPLAATAIRGVRSMVAFRAAKSNGATDLRVESVRHRHAPTSRF
ncbi:MAG: hypothetical protein Q7S40_13970 [Opitutaceae bacterium]|nr:hypothetical protein [Opitutaceae bacterium]